MSQIIKLSDKAADRIKSILSNYKTKNGLTGAIGVIGPKRIDYQRIVPIVSYMSETISKK